MDDGHSTLGRLEVDVADGAARLRDGGALAGGVATLIDVVRRCAGQAGVPLPVAVAVASVAPARALGLHEVVGTLAEGRIADVLAVDELLRPLAVWRRGRRLT